MKSKRLTLSKKSTIGLGIIFILLFGFVKPTLASSGVWSNAGSMSVARSVHTATLLLDGRVLIVGGKTNDSYALASAEIYDPATGLWSVTDSMSIPRYAHTATRLADGRVLVSGGSNGSGGGHDILESAEIYDPVTGMWSETDSMSTARYYFTTVLLTDNKVLAAGGLDDTHVLRSSEIYDPATGMWTASGSMVNIRDAPISTLLLNETVLVTGGSPTEGKKQPELYNPVTGTWSLTGPFVEEYGRSFHTATKLNNGKVLVAGGDTSIPPMPNVINRAEIYDPGTGIWNATGSMEAPRVRHTSTLLKNGKVLVTGGVIDGWHYASDVVLNHTELYNPATGTWSTSGSMMDKRYAHTATLLTDGRILVTGGNKDEYNVLSSTEIYDSPGIFNDVSVSNWANKYVESLYSLGITAGCGGDNYCPDNSVTRAQMAVFLLKGMHGPSYSPPPVNGDSGFNDVAADYWAAPWIKQLAVEGITSGCGYGNYCPENMVTRAQMAIFLLKAKNGPSYTPPATGGSTGFNDVETGYWATAYIKQLVVDGITSGCGDGNYCPDAAVTRAQMAVFLVKAFNLP